MIETAPMSEDFRKMQAELQRVLLDAGSEATTQHNSTGVQLTLHVTDNSAPLSGGHLPAPLHANLVRQQLTEAGIDCVVAARTGGGREIDVQLMTMADAEALIAWVADQLPGHMTAVRRLREAFGRAGLSTQLFGANDGARVYIADIGADDAAALFRALGAEGSIADGMDDMDDHELTELTASLSALILRVTGATVPITARPMCEHMRHHEMRFADLTPEAADQISASLEERYPAAKGKA
jgi:hypothetical protein